MRRFLYNQIARPFAWALPVGLLAAIFGLPITWRLCAFMFLAEIVSILIEVLFPYWKATPKGNNNARS